MKNTTAKRTDGPEVDMLASTFGSAGHRCYHGFQTTPAIKFRVRARCYVARTRFDLSSPTVYKLTSLMWVAIHHSLPKASFTAPLRSPYGWSVGSMTDVPPAATARRYTSSQFGT
jgi:hypothetical protein